VFRGAPNDAEELNVRVDGRLLGVVGMTDIVVVVGVYIRWAGRDDERARRADSGDCVMKGVDVRTVEKRRMELLEAGVGGIEMVL